jgi:hypothetical protein
MQRATGLLLFSFALPTVASAQAKIALGKPDGESPEGFTNISSIRELPNGKVLVADRVDKVVQLVDLVSGSATRVGREGSGPGEYSLPLALIPQPDGSTLLQDPLNRRFLVIGPDGKPGAFADLPKPPTTGQGPGMMLSVTNMQGADARGRIYFPGSPFSFETGTQLDSVPIYRWDRTTSKLDTVAFYKLPPGNASMNRSGGNFAVRIGGSKVFTPAEAWAVTGDGRIARLTPAPYRVVWYDAPGRSAMGPVQPWTPIKVGEAEKEQVREARKRNRPMTISIGPGGGAPPPGARSPQIGVDEPEFEETMPPFGTGGVIGTPDGEVWVLRNRPASEKSPVYDVFDRTGALAKQVTLAPNSRIVGFGKGTVYVAKSDEDDLQYLQRFRKP